MAVSQAELRAALAVSALLPEERRWLEARLSAEERAKLARAVGQIDGQALGGVAARLEAGARAEPKDDAAWLGGHLSQALRAIVAEPAWMQKAIGQALGEALRAQLLNFAAESGPCRDKTDALRRNWAGSLPGAAPMLRDSLLRQLAQCAEAYPDEAPAAAASPAAPAGFWSRLKERWHG
ncbi:hypothetical protein BI347_00090 [Chromobacterium sphagni]|uniref:Uncharacterized protein n=1 Tax=Chromobacterium sphagni TaxID=1903179 RepID=A0A1S1WYP1_9NEIS|nr:hypothetical protein [Chromobacterium sphagni]OHX12066.1 hypothetical protein BI347_00090 [Chromobacterium sphagni]